MENWYAQDDHHGTGRLYLAQVAVAATLPAIYARLRSAGGKAATVLNPAGPLPAAFVQAARKPDNQ
jgi:hypothetical protein